jgi:hypothetical protein
MNRVVDERTVGANEHRLSLPNDCLRQPRRIQLDMVVGIREPGASVIGDLGRRGADPAAGDLPVTPTHVDLREGTAAVTQVAADLIATLQVANFETNRELQRVRQPQRRIWRYLAEPTPPTSLLHRLPDRTIRLTR